MSALLSAAYVATQFVYVPTASAEDTLPSTDGASQDQPKTELIGLQLGTPTPTSKSTLKQNDAMLQWTRTGSNGIEDIYDVRVASTSETDPSTGALVAPVLRQDGVAAPQYDVRSLTDGIYYWQVRSCDAESTCSSWTSVQTVTIDSSSPGAPTGKITSSAYSKTVVISGSAEPASTVTIAIGDRICTTIADQSEKGNWSCIFSGEFEYGSYTALIKSSDSAGNESIQQSLAFTVSELFIAPQITTEELPAVLEIVPIKSIPVNKTDIQAVSSYIDPINTTVSKSGNDDEQAKPALLSADGGIIQPSENGWQIIGLPWFVWLGVATGITSVLWTLGWPGVRRMSSIFSL